MASLNQQENENFTRLSRLLIDKGTEALRNTLDGIHPPAVLPGVLQANRKYLLKLKSKFKVINGTQWDLLFPTSGNPPDSKNFDVTLLTVLLRNICGFKAPSTGWDAMPPNHERSEEANIARLKFLRNKVYAHATTTQVDNATFELLWQKISQALVELKIPQKDVDDLKCCPLGPNEGIYVEELKKCKSQEEKLQSKIEALESSLQSKENEDLLQKLAANNFDVKIRKLVELFHPGSRKWLLRQVDKFVEKDEKSMLLLIAGPGFGKSTFAAKVCEEFKIKKKLAASYFCDFRNSDLKNPRVMLESLATQMQKNVTGFKKKLLGQLSRHHKVQNLNDAFRVYLQNPLDELSLEKPSLVVIDGLDESEADCKNEIMELIANYFPELPKCMKFLLTSRPAISAEKLRDAQKIDSIKIDKYDTKNNSDIKSYFEASLPSLAYRKAENPLELQYEGRSSRSMCEELAENCEGSFLYAFQVQSGLGKRGDLDKIPYDEIMEFVPNNVDSMFCEYFERLEKEIKEIMVGDVVDVLKILELLAHFRGSHLPLGFISRALGLAPDSGKTRNIIIKVNEAASCLLDVSGGLVSVHHKSVIDWLRAEYDFKDHQYAVNDKDGMKSLWLICEKVFEEIKKTVCSRRDLSLTNDEKHALNCGFLYLASCVTEESLVWSVDVVIIHVFLNIYPSEYACRLLRLWEKILKKGGCVVTPRPQEKKFRERLLWHVREFQFLPRKELLDTKPHYLPSVVNSPEGYFSVAEKDIAKSLLSKFPQFVEYKVNDEMEVLPLAVWSESVHIGAVDLSHNKKMAVVADLFGTISVISVPRLVTQCSTKYKRTSGCIPCCLFAPDDSFVLFGRLETVLSIAERKEIPFFHGNKETFTSCAFSPNGKRLVTGDGSNTIKLWDVCRQSLLTPLCADVPVGQCSFSSTGLFIIGASKYVKDGCITRRFDKNSDQRSDEDSESDDDSKSDEDSESDDDSKSDDDSESDDSMTVDSKSDDSLTVDSESDDSMTVDSKSDDFTFEEDPEDSFCVWNALTWQRSDERNLRHKELKEPGIFQKKKCKRCFRPGFKELNISKRLEMQICTFMPLTSSEDRWEAWSTGIYNGVECSFYLKDHSLSVIENTHFTTLAAWSPFVNMFPDKEYINCYKLTAIEDDLWFYADAKTVSVLRTVAPTRLPHPARVLSSSFSPDGSRLATCTLDGYINIWNVNTGQVEQRFRSNQGESSFVCWWSKEFLFVFEFFDRIPSLSKYPVDVNLEILFPQSQQVSLFHLLEKFESLSAIVDFSEGLLSFECGNTTPVKVLDVSGVGEPRMITLPGIEPGMSITVSPGASFVFGGNSDSTYFIWKRNAKEDPYVYEVFFSEPSKKYVYCCFSNDSKVAVGLNSIVFGGYKSSTIFHLDTGGHKSAMFDFMPNFTRLFCLNKDRVVFTARHHFLEFFDMDSGARLGSSIQRYLTRDSLKQLKLSPKETMIAFPKINGDMEFLRLCIPKALSCPVSHLDFYDNKLGK